jgi:hypothetical protein
MSGYWIFRSETTAKRNFSKFSPTMLNHVFIALVKKKTLPKRENCISLFQFQNVQYFVVVRKTRREKSSLEDKKKEKNRKNNKKSHERKKMARRKC